MNNEIIEELKEEIKNFDNQNIYIELENAIQYHTTIENAKILISNEKLFITDEKEKDFIIELHFLDDVEIISNTIRLEMSNDLTITLDY